jgi:hypothetical protein
MISERTLLLTLQTMPTVFPEAPAGDVRDHVEHRAKDQVHLCVRCGRRSQCAQVAGTAAGPRWLDLCASCKNDFLAYLATQEQPSVWE